MWQRGVKFELRTFVPHGFQDIRDKVTIRRVDITDFRVYVLHHVLYFEEFNTCQTQNCPSNGLGLDTHLLDYTPRPTLLR